MGEESVAITKKYLISRIDGKDLTRIETNIVREFTMTVFVNDIEFASLSCSPSDLEYLAVGFILSQGLVTNREDITDIKADKSGKVWLYTSHKIDAGAKLKLTSSGGRSSDTSNIVKRIQSQVTIPADRVFSLMDEFDRYSRDFRKTGGVHSAALCDAEKILIFHEDIGRHNAIDKVFGQCFMDGITTDNYFLLTSGRVPSDIMNKVALRKVPVLIARKSPTDLSVEIAEKAGVTLLGFVRDTRMNIYSHAWRIVR
ncbi:MAG: formate dehydrogenase family accessory protein FdhD [Chloroflexi bacterium RBG_13_46_14]|nr:MAG: formate dehydrogenase family accessory protein FdhD [Chloroflexi bacterium RBG_13_46_14]